jgi:hypothetical protein
VREKAQAGHRLGVTSPGIHRLSRDRVTAHVEHRYRDQLVDAERTVENVKLSENLAHRTYRRLRRRPYPSIMAPEACADILARWANRAPAPTSAVGGRLAA